MLHRVDSVWIGNDQVAAMPGVSRTRGPLRILHETLQHIAPQGFMLELPDRALRAKETLDRPEVAVE